MIFIQVKKNEFLCDIDWEKISYNLITNQTNKNSNITMFFVRNTKKMTVCKKGRHISVF